MIFGANAFFYNFGLAGPSEPEEEEDIEEPQAAAAKVSGVQLHASADP